jgi:outer membrane protein insertion porin family
LYSTGLFEDIDIESREAPTSSDTTPRIDLTINLKERKSGGLGAGGGISASSHTEGALPG